MAATPPTRSSRPCRARRQEPADEVRRWIGVGPDQAWQQLSQHFDPVYGGFGRAPKFPSPHNLLFLLRYWKRTGHDQALPMVEKTLQAIRRGGVYDQVGFGFHRYSIDREWLVPHFEKMLYDQALLRHGLRRGATRPPASGSTRRSPARSSPTSCAT